MNLGMVGMGELRINKKKFSREFKHILIAQFVSTVGDTMSGIALPYLIYYQTKSVSSMVFMMITFWLPNLLFAPFIGVLTDLVNKKKLMIGMDFVRAILIFLVPYSNIYFLYVICFLLSSMSQVFNLAKFGLTPVLVEESKLVEANAIVQRIDLMTNIGGPLLGGAIISLLGQQIPFYIDAISFLVSGLIIWKVNVPKTNETESRDSKDFLLNFKTGFTYVKTNKVVLFSMSLFIFVMMFAMPINTLFYPLLQGEFKATGWQIGLAVSLFSGGTFLGTLISPRMVHLFNRINLILVGILLNGLCMALLALTKNYFIAMAFYTTGAFFNGFINPLNVSLRQENIPKDLVGRVNGMYYSVVNVLSIVMMLITGIVGGKVGVRNIYFVAGIGYAAAAVIGRFLPWYKDAKAKYVPLFVRETARFDGIGSIKKS